MKHWSLRNAFLRNFEGNNRLFNRIYYDEIDYDALNWQYLRVDCRQYPTAAQQLNYIVQQFRLSAVDRDLEVKEATYITEYTDFMRGKETLHHMTRKAQERKIDTLLYPQLREIRDREDALLRIIADDLLIDQDSYLRIFFDGAENSITGSLPNSIAGGIYCYKRYLTNFDYLLDNNRRLRDNLEFRVQVIIARREIPSNEISGAAEIIWKKYSQQALRHILEIRARDAFHEVIVPGTDLDAIAMKAAASGDACYALDLLLERGTQLDRLSTPLTGERGAPKSITHQSPDIPAKSLQNLFD